MLLRHSYRASGVYNCFRHSYRAGLVQTNESHKGERTDRTTESNIITTSASYFVFRADGNREDQLRRTCAVEVRRDRSGLSREIEKVSNSETVERERLQVPEKRRTIIPAVYMTIRPKAEGQQTTECALQ